MDPRELSDDELFELCVAYGENAKLSKGKLVCALFEMVQRQEEK